MQSPRVLLRRDGPADAGGRPGRGIERRARAACDAGGAGRGDGGVGLLGHLAAAAMLAAGLAAPLAVGDGDGLVVHHRALDARPRTHVDADLLAHEAAEGEGRRGQDRDRGPGDGRGGEGGELAEKRRRVGEIEDPRAAGGEGDEKPERPLDRALADLLPRPGRVPQLHPRVAVALDPALDEDEEVDPDRLRAGVAAPDPAEGGGEEEEAEAGHDEEAGDEVELLRPDLDEEEVEATVGEVDEHRLVGERGTAVPAEPGGDVVDGKGDGHDPPLQRPERAGDAAGEDRLARRVELRRFGAGIGQAGYPGSSLRTYIYPPGLRMP